MNSNIRVITEKHLFHIVDHSPWPIFAAFSALFMTFGGTMVMHSYSYGTFILKLGLITLILTLYGWFRDVIREGLEEGHHTLIVQGGMKMGMILFIVSEVMFFFSFFWGFFHSALVPSIEIGAMWPPYQLAAIDPWSLPYLNTLLLLTSGVYLTISHEWLLKNDRETTLVTLDIVYLVGIVFILLQGVEYQDAPFSISDGVFGSVFYMATGFHGFHVGMGSIMLIIMRERLSIDHMNYRKHVGFECAAWYWHFVDVVWIGLWLMIYYWGYIPLNI